MGKEKEPRDRSKPDGPAGAKKGRVWLKRQEPVGGGARRSQTENEKSERE